MAQVCLPAMMLRAVMNARDDSGSSGSGSSGTDSDSERVRRRNLGHQLLHPDDDVSPSSTQPSPPQFWRFGGDIPGVGPFDTLAVPPPSGVQNAAGDAQVQAAAPPKKKRKRKYRKGTHTIRKEEIASLHQEIVELRRHLEALKSASLPATANGEPESEQDREFREKIFSNRLLRRALRQQQSKFAPVHALMTNYTLWEAEGGCELHQFLHLESDEHLRQTALTAMKTHAINRGKQFLQRRWPHVDPWRPMKQEHFFESSRGDYMGISKATMPFRRITSVKTAFDAVLSFFNNLEISASEQFGSITIREDNDSADSGVAQNRLVTTAPSGLRMESNTIFFSCYYDVDSGWGDQPEHGIVICNFVDHDERYPYLTDERIRRDVSAVVEVKRHTMQDHETGEMKTAVVLTRWVQTKLHLPTFKVEPDDWEALCEKMERWVHILQPKLLEGLV